MRLEERLEERIEYLYQIEKIGDYSPDYEYKHIIQMKGGLKNGK
jgi:hypothetical protein